MFRKFSSLKFGVRTLSTTSKFKKMSMWPPLMPVADAISLSGEANVKIIDGSWFLDKSRNAKLEHSSERIPGAVHFDIDEISDKTTSLPHMLPTPEFFAEKMGELGICKDDGIIIYESGSCFGAPRVWWTFRAFSHLKVSILEGGLQAWKQAGGAIESGERSQPIARAEYKGASLNKDIVASSQDVMHAVRTGVAQIADARSSGRFYGTAPEPRAGLASGHIPGSLNIPFDSLLDPADKTKLLPPDALREVFESPAVGVVPGARLICSCGSGVTASVIAFARHVAGEEVGRTAVYDGSWTEWGADESFPKSTFNPNVQNK
jgi:thiosulfate/3-mercaptopyruvate sulfurtransferase